jgi:hypothetical protein
LTFTSEYVFFSISNSVLNHYFITSIQARETPDKVLTKQWIFDLPPNPRASGTFNRLFSIEAKRNMEKAHGL